MVESEQVEPTVVSLVPAHGTAKSKSKSLVVPGSVCWGPFEPVGQPDPGRRRQLGGVVGEVGSLPHVGE